MTTKHWVDNAAAEVLITTAEIKKAIEELGDKLTRDYEGKSLLVIVILRGGVLFAADLVRAIRFPVEVEFMAVSSYGKETQSSGVVQILKDVQVSLVHRDVLVVEDIVDTGLTWACLKSLLLARQPNSLKICTLLDKPGMRQSQVVPDYVGFEIPNKFVAGYGLDWKDSYRNVPFIFVPQLATCEEKNA